MTTLPTPKNLEGLLADLGLEDIRPGESEIPARCPMHAERTGRREDHPRHWSINRETGSHHCFSCGYSGGLLTLVMDVKGWDPFESARWIHTYGVELMMPEPDPRPVNRPRQVEEINITKYPPPPPFVFRRRGLSQSAVDYFGLRWNPEEKTWIIPIRTPGGKLIGWQEKGGRIFNNRPPRMPKGSTLFGIDKFNGGQAILVESPLDAAYIWELGYPGALASCGVNVTDAQMRLVVEYADELVLALDNDGPGKMQTRTLVTGWDHDSRGRLVKKINWALRVPTKVFNYYESKAKDPGEMTPEDVVWGIENAKHSLEWGRVKK